MKLALVGPTNKLDDTSYDAQRTVNLIPERSETGTSKEPDRLISAPGYVLFATAGGGPIRGEITTAGGRNFQVSGSTFYELSSTGTATSRGTLNTAIGRCSLAENGSQIMIVDGTNGYIFTMSTNDFSQIADAQFPNGATICAFMDTYFLANDPGTGDFYISDNNDGTSWAALDKTSVESSPDNLVSLLPDHGELILPGTYTTEFYYNASASDPSGFPFKRKQEGVMQVGCAAAHTLKSFNNNVMWLAQTRDGGRFIARINQSGVRHEKVSPKWLDQLLEGLDDVSDAYAFTYKQDGHDYYVLQVPGLFTTPVFDAATERWHERVYFNAVLNREERWRASGFSYFDGNHLIGDRDSGAVYELSPDYYDDNGEEIHRIRILSHVSQEMQSMTLSEVILDMETGVGDTDEPQVMLSVSKDGGRNYGNERWRGFGKLGNYRALVRWLRFGQAKVWTFKIRITANKKISLHGFYIN